jgi:inorganic pyrophosphatase
MSVFFDYNPDTGVTQTFDYDPVTENVNLTSHQDLDFFFKQIKDKRDNPDAWAKGVKESFAHYATIPAVVEIELKKKGIDINNPNQTKELLKEINENYPYLKTTTKIIK